jgi:hypothetical protein
MQRAAVAADKQCRALEQRTQLQVRELAALKNSTCRLRSEALAGVWRSAARAAATAPKCSSGQRRNGLPALTCSTIT